MVPAKMPATPEISSASPNPNDTTPAPNSPPGPESVTSTLKA